MAERQRRQAGRDSTQGIAAERCAKLLSLAKEVYPKEPQLSLRYVALARRLAMRHRLPLGQKDFCKKCGTVWIAGVTLSVRTVRGEKRVAYRCLKCGHARFFGYQKRNPPQKAPAANPAKSRRTP